MRAAAWLQLIWFKPRVNSLPLDTARSVVLHPGTKVLFEVCLDEWEPTIVVVAPSSYGMLHGSKSPTYRACFWNNGPKRVLGSECRTSSMDTTTFVIPGCAVSHWEHRRSSKTTAARKHRHKGSKCDDIRALLAVTPDDSAWLNVSVRACTGAACDAPCPTTCANHSRCERRTGTCRCSRGHAGADCTVPVVFGDAPPYRRGAQGVWRIEKKDEDAWDGRRTRIRYAVLVLGFCTASCTGILAALLFRVTNHVQQERQERQETTSV